MTFGIIGFGRFGQLWAHCLEKLGTVKIFDKKVLQKGNPHCVPLKEVKEVVDVDILFLLVPISQIENICKKIHLLLDPHTVVIDACSVKVHPVVMMKKWLPANQPIIATHPLFGPDSVKRLGIKGQKIVVSNIRTTPQQFKQFSTILKTLELTVIKTTPEKHDLQMAHSQALVHFLGRGLAGLHLRPQHLATPDYAALLHMNEMVNNDTWQLFFDMQNFNPYTRDIRKIFLKSLQKVDHEITKKQKKRN